MTFIYDTHPYFVPYDDRAAMVRAPDSVVYTKGKWVKVRRGLYGGDVGCVLHVNKDGDSVDIAVLPRWKARRSMVEVSLEERRKAHPRKRIKCGWKLAARPEGRPKAQRLPKNVLIQRFNEDDKLVKDGEVIRIGKVEDINDGSGWFQCRGKTFTESGHLVLTLQYSSFYEYQPSIEEEAAFFSDTDMYVQLAYS